MSIKKYISLFIGICISLPFLVLIAYFCINYKSIASSFNFDEISNYITTTTYLLAGTAFCVFILGIITAFLSARFIYTGSKIFSILFVLPLAFPAYILGYCYVGFFEFNGILSTLTNGYFKKLDILNIYGCIFILSIAMYPYVFLLAKVSFGSISSTVIDVVKINNIGKFKAFFTVYLPLSYPAVFAGIVLALMETLSDYGTVFYFGVETFSVGVFKSWFGYGDLFGAINLAIALLLFVFICLIIEAIFRARLKFTSSTHSNKKAQKIKLSGMQNILAFAISLAISFMAFLLPLSVLIYWFYLDIGELDYSAINYLLNTLYLNISSSFFIIGLSFVAFYFARIYPVKYGVYIQRLSMLGYAIPGAVVAIGALIVSSGFDELVGQKLLSGTFFILIFAYTTRYFAASIGSVENGFSKIDKNIDDASKVFGIGDLKNIYSIYFPILKPYLFSGFLILYIDIAKELPATLLLRPFNYDTIAIRIYELSSNEILYKTAFPSLLLLASTIAAILLLNLKLIKGR